MGGQRKLAAERCRECGLHEELCACTERPLLDACVRMIVVQNNRERHKPTNTGRMVVQVLRDAELLRWGVLERPRADAERPGTRGHWREGGADGEVLEAPSGDSAAIGASAATGESDADGGGDSPGQLRTQEFDETPLLRPDLDYVLIFPRHRDPESTQSEPAPELNARVFAERRAARPDAKPTIVLLDGTWAQCSRMSRRIEAIARMDAYRLPPGPNGHWGVRRASEPERVSTFEAAIRVMELAGELEVAAAMQTYFDSIAARMQFMKGKLPRPEVPEAWIAERQARFSG